MRNLFVSAIVAGAMAFSSAAFAANAAGVVAAFDAETLTLTLEDGSAYVLPAEMADAEFKAGDKVDLTFEEVEGKNVASEVVVSE